MFQKKNTNMLLLPPPPYSTIPSNNWNRSNIYMKFSEIVILPNSKVYHSKMLFMANMTKFDPSLRYTHLWLFEDRKKFFQIKIVLIFLNLNVNPKPSSFFALLFFLWMVGYRMLGRNKTSKIAHHFLIFY